MLDIEHMHQIKIGPAALGRARCNPQYGTTSTCLHFMYAVCRTHRLCGIIWIFYWETIQNI